LGLTGSAETLLPLFLVVLLRGLAAAAVFGAADLLFLGVSAIPSPPGEIGSPEARRPDRVNFAANGGCSNGVQGTSCESAVRPNERALSSRIQKL
jgi:hypothetical protein